MNKRICAICKVAIDDDAYSNPYFWVKVHNEPIKIEIPVSEHLCATCTGEYIDDPTDDGGCLHVTRLKP